MVVMQMVALETSVKGNTVTVKVKDFARLKGFKEIQLYIPAKLKANSDLTPYKDQLVPNKATVNFKDANGQSGNKETKPVTVNRVTQKTNRIQHQVNQLSLLDQKMDLNLIKTTTYQTL